MPDQFKPGSYVFDLPSKQYAFVVDVIRPDNICTVYILDNTIPLDPTGDGAFPTRGRIESEICSPDPDTIELSTRDFSY